MIKRQSNFKKRKFAQQILKQWQPFCFQPTSMSCNHNVAVQLMKVMLYASTTQQA
jgi:hypothetical protein